MSASLSTTHLTRASACVLLLALALAALPNAAKANDQFLKVRSYNPFTQIFGRPEFFAGWMADPGVAQTRGALSVVSFSEIEQVGGTTLELDGEAYHLDLSYQRVFAPRIEIGARLPVLHHTGGWMDGPLTDWHDLLGVPNGKRDLQPRDALRLYFDDGLGERVLVDDAGSGIGDLQLWTRYQLSSPGAGRQLALHGGIKVPTGNPDRLTGSGAFDLSIGAGLSDPLTLRAIRTTLSANVGVIWLGTGDVLPAYQKDSALFAGVQAAVRLNRKLSLIAGVQGTSAYYDSDIGAIGDETVQLIFGGHYRFDSGWQVRMGIVEDGLSRVMPDFAVHLDISRRLGSN